MITSKISRLALVSGFAILATVALTPKAQAQTANVDFEGSNPATCQINSVTNGTLAVSSTDPGRAMVADATDGTPGNLNVTCNGGAQFTITSVIDNGSIGGTSFADIDNKFVGIADNATSTYVGMGIGLLGTLLSGPIIDKDYKVHLLMSEDAPALLLPGTYKVRVAVSLAPQ